MISTKSKTALALGRAIGFVVFLLLPHCASSQVESPVRNPPSFRLFSTVTFGSSDFGNNHSQGYVIGGSMQSSRLWGAEMRGSYLRWGYQERRYDAVIGPRVARHYGRMTLYGAALAGPGHVITFHDKDYSSWRSGTAIEWKILGGVDYFAGRRWSVRLGEISFEHAYVLHGFSAVDLSAGVVYRVPLERWERR